MRELKIERCFRLIETKGRLSIVKPCLQNEWQFGDIWDYAVMYTEMTEGTSSHRSKAFRDWETQHSSAKVEDSQGKPLGSANQS